MNEYRTVTTYVTNSTKKT